jgi:hypothetical protein
MLPEKFFDKKRYAVWHNSRNGFPNDVYFDKNSMYPLGVAVWEGISKAPALRPHFNSLNITHPHASFTCITALAMLKRAGDVAANVNRLVLVRYFNTPQGKVRDTPACRFFVAIKSEERQLSFVGLSIPCLAEIEYEKAILEHRFWLLWSEDSDYVPT